MSVPNVQIVSFDEMMEMAGGAEQCGSNCFFTNRRGCFR